MKPIAHRSELRSRRLVLLSCLVLAALPGCAMKNWVRHRNHEAHSQVFTKTATLDEITDHLNQERSRVMGWRSTDVRIKATGEGIIAPSLSASICVQSPRNLRLMASSPLGTEVDFGSNTDRFWFWAKRQEPKILMTGSHEGLGQQQVLPIPFPPAWLMEALGVVPLDTTGVRMEPDETTAARVRLISATSDGGRAAKRVMVVDLSRGQVIEHALYDEADNLVASAAMSDFRQEANGVTLPHHIELNWPETKSVLKLQIGKVDVNPKIDAQTWKLPSYPNYEVVDLDRATQRRR